MLELDTLRILVAIADTGNFSAAAEVLFRTPSAVSMQVKKAEEVLGRPLSEQISKPAEAAADHLRVCVTAKKTPGLNVVGGV